MEIYDIYRDIDARTNGEIYMGVVGPVRTGKSTFIKRFMDLMVLPNMTNYSSKERARDELPQSASGKTVMTAEPKFVPNEAAEIVLTDEIKVKVRLIDCVGYMVDGAVGHMENGEERKVKTPWFEQEIPFTKAASIGTQKVIRDHSTIGIVMTTDGSIGDLNRDDYLLAEETTIKELQSIGKPFVVLVNSTKPYSAEAQKVVQNLQDKYAVSAMSVNCEQLREEDIHKIMKTILLEFPVSEVLFHIPKWIEMLDNTHKIKKELIQYIKKLMSNLQEMKDAIKNVIKPSDTCIQEIKINNLELSTGTISVDIDVEDYYYYEMLSDLSGTNISNEYELIHFMREMSEVKKEYDGIKDAFLSVKQKGYGMVSPGISDIKLDEPELIKQGNKYGVKIHSEAPSIHMIRANIETEIAPIVGSEQQAQDLIAYIKEDAKADIFGKSIEDLVMDGMRSKLMMINEESQEKLQDTMQKIVNDSNGGMVCIII